MLIITKLYTVKIRYAEVLIEKHIQLMLKFQTNATDELPEIQHEFDLGLGHVTDWGFDLQKAAQLSVIQLGDHGMIQADTEHVIQAV